MSRSRTRLLIASLSATAALIAAPAAAEYGPRLDVAELAEASVAVLHGRVYSVDSGWDAAGSAIYTYIRLDVEEALAGGVAERQVVIKQLGGVVGDLGQYVGGQASFRPGEEVVVFLELRPRDRTVYTTALWQGKWTVRDDDGVAMASRHAGYEADGAEVTPETVELRVLRDTVRSAPVPRARAARAIQLHPPEAPAPRNTVGQPAPRTIPLLGFSWHEAFAGQVVPFDFHRRRIEGLGNGKTQLQAAIERWTGVPRTLPVLERGRRRRGAAPGPALRDPRGVQDLLLQNGDPTGEVDDEGGTLALGGAWFFTDILTRGLMKATNGFIVTNDSAGALAFLTDRQCYENIVAHEVGHTAGLGHSDQAQNLMFPSIGFRSCSEGPIALGTDDQRTYRKIYNRKFGRPER